jgi:ribosomal subunit interface protein
MNISIKATNTTLTSNIKEFIHDKISVLEKFLKPEDKIHVELEVEKKHSSGMLYRVEVIIKPHGHYAESRGMDFYAAMDLVMPKIKTQFAKNKDKQVSLRRRRTKVR